ncbi:MAG: sulfite exporter TauE/SafE family protein, partial [Eubacteriales bacterium]|nr:sulfite exporter TauE/SafE family protein [Eubacteriales bacterium]
PCGPLQIVQLYGLGTRSVIFGALSMFIFSLGTVPLLFSFGAMNTFINKKNINRILKVSALLVIILGFVMAARGFALSGVMINVPAMVHSSKNNVGEAAIARIDGSVQTVTISIKPNSFTPIVVQKGIPVRWVINADPANLNECNKAIHSSKFRIEQELSQGENIVEFTPQEEGEFVYTCWMGMIKSKITVVEDLRKITTEKTTEQSVVQEQVSVSEHENTKSSSITQEELQTTVQREPDAGKLNTGNEGTAPEVSNSPIPPKPANITKTILISGMMCQGCVQYVKNALSAIGGVQSVEVVIGRATVVLNREVSNESLKAAVEKEGKYKVTSISAGASPSGTVN